MNKTCLKCGYQRRQADKSPDYACPACDVVYTKYEAKLVRDIGLAKEIRDQQVIDNNAQPLETRNKVDIAKKYGYVFLIFFGIILGLQVYNGEMEYKNGEIRFKEIVTNTIEIRNEVAYLPKSDKPFTGRLEEFHPNGQIKQLKIFKEGKGIGLTTAWWENGQKLYEMTFKNGESGEWTVWDDEGHVIWGKNQVSPLENLGAWRNASYPNQAQICEHLVDRLSQPNLTASDLCICISGVAGDDSSLDFMTITETAAVCALRLK
ncbi:toxin-antitoxin system YwqK family antitoxin [Crenothrix sp.]|uniref:toxin-antitoxin system YwqK family antitoxin n=1 Tax=Crenothrix sp. TaxID=3100433 RepID=UPI00374CC22C